MDKIQALIVLIIGLLTALYSLYIFVQENPNITYVVLFLGTGIVELILGSYLYDVSKTEKINMSSSNGE